MLKIHQRELLGRALMFQTRLREEPPRGIAVAYTNTLADPRIDADAIDMLDASRSFMSITYHYVVRVDGVVEVGRDPKRLTSRTRKPFVNHDELHVGTVGGLNENGEREQTTTQEQAEALAELEQALADALGKPLEVHDARVNWCKSPEERDAYVDPDQIDEAEIEQEAALDALELA